MGKVATNFVKLHPAVVICGRTHRYDEANFRIFANFLFKWALE